LLAKRAVAPLVNGRARLRLLEEADLALTREWRNQDHIRQWFFDANLISPEQHRAWWQRYRDRDDDFVFVIEETDTLKGPVGQVSLYNIDWTARRAEFGRLMIGEPGAVGLGIAQLATSALLRFAFQSWPVREIYLDVLPTNAPAIAVYRACGFEPEPSIGPAIRMTVDAARGRRQN
jgi:diamine N-acetyltransferase